MEPCIVRVSFSHAIARTVKWRYSSLPRPMNKNSDLDAFEAKGEDETSSKPCNIWPFQASEAPQF